MEEVASSPKDQSKVSINTCEELEDLGSLIEKNVANEVLDQTEDSKQLPLPETEIENLLADLQVTHDDEVLNDDTQNSNGLLESNNSVSQSCAVFNHVFYLGSHTVNGPRNDIELKWLMSVFNRKHCDQLIEISLSIPSNADGCVILYEAGSSTKMTRYPINRINYCARGPGPEDTPNSSCFAFTCPQDDSEENPIFKCHVFRCENAEVFPEVMRSLYHASRKPEDLPPLAESPEWVSGHYTFLGLIEQPFTPRTKTPFPALIADAVETWKIWKRQRETK